MRFSLGGVSAISLAGSSVVWAQTMYLPAINGGDFETISGDALVAAPPGNVPTAALHPIIGASRFYNEGYQGQSTISYNIEAGHVWNGHESLGHVTNFVTGTGAINEFDRHATWAGMLIGGRDPSGFISDFGTGIAPATTLRSGAIATSYSGTRYTLAFGISGDSFLSAYTTAFGTADVINSSWGGSGSTAASAGSDFTSVGIDALARANPNTTYVGSAGNSGPGANTVGSPASGYNGISVGALQNDGNDNYNAIANFSSRGPQPYVDPISGTVNNARAPVDIVAPGTSLITAYYGGETGGNRAPLGGAPSGLTSDNNLYSIVGGTSFSAPIVAGGVSLMKSAAKGEGLPSTALDTRVVKASLLNAAQKTPGWNNGQTLSGGVYTTTQSLDYTTGAGAMDLDQTYDQYITGETDITGTTGGTSLQPVGWDLATVSLGNEVRIVLPQLFQGGTEFNTTLAFFRARSIEGTSLFDDKYANLNLEVWDSTFTTKFAESVSLYNEVEHLSFDLLATTTLGLRVVYVSDLFAFETSPETFGLAWAGTLIPEPTLVGLASLLLMPMARRRR